MNTKAHMTFVWLNLALCLIISCGHGSTHRIIAHARATQTTGLTEFNCIIVTNSFEEVEPDRIEVEVLDESGAVSRTPMIRVDAKSAPEYTCVVRTGDQTSFSAVIVATIEGSVIKHPDRFPILPAPEPTAK